MLGVTKQVREGGTQAGAVPRRNQGETRLFRESARRGRDDGKPRRERSQERPRSVFEIGWLGHRAHSGQVTPLRAARPNSGPEVLAFQFAAVEHDFQVQIPCGLSQLISAFAGGGGAGERNRSPTLHWRRLRCVPRQQNRAPREIRRQICMRRDDALRRSQGGRFGSNQIARGTVFAQGPALRIARGERVQGPVQPFEWRAGQEDVEAAAAQVAVPPEVGEQRLGHADPPDFRSQGAGQAAGKGFGAFQLGGQAEGP